MMDITPMTMYWLTRCSILNSAGFMLAILGGLASLFIHVAMFCEDDFKEMKRAKTMTVSAFSAMVLGLLLCIFVPTTKEMAAIIVVPKIASSQTVNDIGKEVVDLAKTWLVELKPKNNAADKWHLFQKVQNHHD